jgi:hypothetical protein
MLERPVAFRYQHRPGDYERLLDHFGHFHFARALSGEGMVAGDGEEHLFAEQLDDGQAGVGDACEARAGSISPVRSRVAIDSAEAW